MGSKKCRTKKILRKRKQQEPTDSEIKEETLLEQYQRVSEQYYKAKEYLREKNIGISTITLDCKIGSQINLDNFAKKLVLKENEIVSVKYGKRDAKATNRTIVIFKVKSKQSKINFYNQVTIKMKPMNNIVRNYINIKVFQNGSLQMTGCKDMDDFYNVTETLIRILREGRFVKMPDGSMKFFEYAIQPEKLGIYNVKIRMINSDFKLGYKVERKKLSYLLKTYHKKNTKDTEIGYVENKYEPGGGHSCVNIKYQYDTDNRVSIFVFQTGSVIITGAKNLDHIIKSHEFILKILNKYYDMIKIVEIPHEAIIEALKEYRQIKMSSSE